MKLEATEERKDRALSMVLQIARFRYPKEREQDIEDNHATICSLITKARQIMGERN